MKKALFWSTTIITAAIAIAAANAQTPPSPQMRGDGPPPESKPFSITKNDPAFNVKK